MFTENQEKYLLRALSNNDVVLFLGAGFSRLALNYFGYPMPLGNEFSKLIWEFLKYPGEYDSTSLQTMYEAFLEKGISRDEKTRFLESNLLAKDIPDIYELITIPYWYKIYTTNVDDIIDKAYRKVGKRLDTLSYPDDHFKDRDMSLEKIQTIFLNGKLPCNPEDLIFSTMQYAKTAIEYQPLYIQFVHDYATKPVIFVGSNLNEPLFEQYIQARERRQRNKEYRPQSFLILPELSPVKIDIFERQYNVDFIKGTTEDFLNWIKKVQSQLPTWNEILIKIFPSFPKLIETIGKKEYSHKYLSDFASSLRPIPKDFKVPDNYRSGFLLGNTPRWHDIFSNLDAPRTITRKIFDEIEKNLDTEKEIEIISLFGSGGSGKSTIVRRLGLSLSLNGRQVFLTDSEFIPKPDVIYDILELLSGRSVLIFDNAENTIGILKPIINKLKELSNPPVIILATRVNNKAKLAGQIDTNLKNTIYDMPDLDKEEIIDILSVLEKNNLLNRLRGMTIENRIREFEYRAKKQILVSMREATSGKSFDQIIESEFTAIENIDAKFLCLCIALNTEQGYTVSEQDLIGFSDIPPAETLFHLNNTLSGIVLRVGPKNDKLLIRHKVIAEYYVSRCSDIELLTKAYIKVLSVLAPQILYAPYGSRKFNLYRELINHLKVFKRFKENIDNARYIYDSLSKLFSDDYQFWLQYGSLEAEGRGGDLDRAENYVNQAESLSSNSFFIKNAKGNILYKKSLSYPLSDFESARAYKEEAANILLNSIKYNGNENPYPYIIYCNRQYDWIVHFIKDKETKKTELEALRKIARQGTFTHPTRKEINELFNIINRAYLNMGVDAELPDPIYIPPSND